jgi:hypothetical protein
LTPSHSEVLDPIKSARNLRLYHADAIIHHAVNSLYFASIDVFGGDRGLILSLGEDDRLKLLDAWRRCLINVVGEVACYKSDVEV